MSCGIKYLDIRWPLPNRAASVLSKRVDLEITPKSVDRWHSKKWSICSLSVDENCKAEVMPGLNITVPGSNVRPGRRYVCLINKR